MKKFLLFSLCCVFCGLIACAQEATVDDIIAKVTEASGGGEKLAAITDQVTTWDFKMMMMPPMEGMSDEDKAKMADAGPEPMTITYKSPNMIRFDMFDAEGNTTMISSFDGAGGWEMMMGQSQPMNEAKLQETETMAATWMGLGNYAALGMTATLLPNETVDEQEYIVIECTDKYNSVLKHYIDPTTYYIEMSSGEMLNMMGVKEQQTMVYKDYQMHDGMPYPKYVATHNKDGDLVWEATLKEIKYNTGVEASAFAQEMTAK